MRKDKLTEEVRNTLAEKAIELCKEVNITNPVVEHICVVRNDRYRVSVGVGEDDDHDVMDMYFDDGFLLTKVVGMSEDNEVLDDLIDIWECSKFIDAQNA